MTHSTTSNLFSNQTPSNSFRWFERGNKLIRSAFVVMMMLFFAENATAKVPRWVIDGLLIQHPGKYRVEYLGVYDNESQRYRLEFNHEQFIMFDGAMGPDFHSAQLWEFTKVNPGESFLEIGTGIGVLAINAARIAGKVVATDIEPVAIENAKYNAQQKNLGGAIDFRVGDLLAPINDNELFDVILFNVIYPHNKKTQHFWALHERFLSHVSKHLNDSGRIYYQAGYWDNLPHIQKIVDEAGFKIMEMHMWEVPAYKRQPMTFMLQRKPTTK